MRDPSLDVTEQLVLSWQEAGADLIELGIPFSDPTAEGPVIQAANVRALSGGVTTDKIFDMVVRIRQKTDIPMVFMTYANVVYSYGTERFIAKGSDIGMNGLILPDVPFEEKKGIRQRLQNLRLRSDITHRAYVSRADHAHCKGSRRLRVLCFISWCHRNALCHHNGYRCYGKAGEGCKEYSVCRRLWNLDTAAGR